MSRSYKKNPGYTSSGSKCRKFFKRQSNKKARKNWNLPIKGRHHRKDGLTYDICDWRFIYFRESDYEWRDWRTGEIKTIPENERYKMRIK